MRGVNRIAAEETRSGRGGFSRLDCRKCKRETQHCQGVCAHCGTVYRMAKPRQPKLGYNNQVLRGAAKRGRRNGSSGNGDD